MNSAPVEQRHGRRAQTAAGVRFAKDRSGHALVTAAGQLCRPTAGRATPSPPRVQDWAGTCSASAEIQQPRRRRETVTRDTPFVDDVRTVRSEMT